MFYLDDLYSEEVKTIYFEMVESEFERVIKDQQQNIKWNPGNTTALMKQCKRLVGDETFNRFFQGENKFRQLVLLPPIYIKELRDCIEQRFEAKVISKKDMEKTIIQRLKAVYTTSFLGKKHNNIKLNTLLVESLNTVVCPYCNRNFINSRNDNLGAQMDHFYNKDKYPIFAVSLYNFIPVCGVCNNLKRTTDFQVYPFIEYTEEYDVSFNYRLKSLEDIEVTLSTNKERKKDLETLKLKEAYAIHSLDIKNMLEREQRYSETYRKELRQLLKGQENFVNDEFRLSLADDEIDRMIYGDSVFEEDVRNIPLGKFRKDIYNEIKSLRGY